MDQVNFTLYRKSMLGEALNEALRDLVESKEVSTQLVDKTLKEFDKVQKSSNS